MILFYCRTIVYGSAIICVDSLEEQRLSEKTFADNDTTTTTNNNNNPHHQRFL